MCKQFSTSRQIPIEMDKLAINAAQRVDAIVKNVQIQIYFPSKCSPFGGEAKKSSHLLARRRRNSIRNDWILLSLDDFGHATGGRKSTHSIIFMSLFWQVVAARVSPQNIRIEKKRILNGHRIRLFCASKLNWEEEEFLIGKLNFRAPDASRHYRPNPAKQTNFTKRKTKGEIKNNFFSASASSTPIVGFENIFSLQLITQQVESKSICTSNSIAARIE